MSYWILLESVIAMSCNTVQRVTHIDNQTDEYKKQMNDFQKGLEGKWQVESSNVSDKAIQDVPASMLLSLENEDEQFLDEFNWVIKYSDLAEAEDEQVKSSEYGVEESYLDMEIGIRRDDEKIHHARFQQRTVNQDGRPIGRPSNNPLIDRRRYEVEYLDGTTEVLTANIIMENFLAQDDDQGHFHLMIDEIEDH